MRLRILVCGVTMVYAMSLAESSQALTLSDLAAGAGFSTGSLSFGRFAVTTSGSIDGNLADYEVQPLGDGFRIAGGAAVFDGDQGSLHISYEVTDSAAGGVDGVGLQFDGAAAGRGSGTMVTDNAFDASNHHLASGSVFSSGGGGSALSSTTSFGPQTDLFVEEGVVLKSIGLASGAVISAIDDHFTAMPEPASLLLLSGGLAGLFAMGRRHGR